VDHLSPEAGGSLLANLGAKKGDANTIAMSTPESQGFQPAKVSYSSENPIPIVDSAVVIHESTVTTASSTSSVSIPDSVTTESVIVTGPAVIESAPMNQDAPVMPDQ
jgi:hypothetical protein